MPWAPLLAAVGQWQAWDEFPEQLQVNIRREDAAATTAHLRTTALSDAGFSLLNALLTCDPEQRETAAGALGHRWFAQAPLPVPLSRSEIRQLRRTRDEAISSGAHTQALAQQAAASQRKAALEQAAAIAASFGLPPQ